MNIVFWHIIHKYSVCVVLILPDWIKSCVAIHCVCLEGIFYATFNTVLKGEYGRYYVKINSLNTHIVYNIAAYPCADLKPPKKMEQWFVMAG